MNEGACFCTQVGVIDKDCVCQGLLVSTKLDTNGWMTYYKELNVCVCACMRACIRACVHAWFCGICLPQVRMSVLNYRIVLSQDTLSEQWDKKPLYVVGVATAIGVQSLGLSPQGEETGQADKQTDLIIQY